MSRRPSRQPVRDGREHRPESSRTYPAYNTSEESRQSYEQQGFASQHHFYPLDQIDTMAEQSERPRIPTNEDLPFDSRGKKPVQHQRLDCSYAGLLFKWEYVLRTKRECLLRIKREYLFRIKRECLLRIKREGLLRTKDSTMGNVGQSNIHNIGQSNTHNTGQHNLRHNAGHCRQRVRMRMMMISLARLKNVRNPKRPSHRELTSLLVQPGRQLITTCLPSS